jgi:ABC-type multidrug transport system fused ATPase/permease subunit
MGNNRDKLEGPILYDSLDKPNSPYMNKSKPQKHADYGLALIITLALFVAAIVTYGLMWLNSAALYNTTAVVLLWIVNVSVVLAIVGLLFALVMWLVLRALKDAVISLDDGVPVSVIGVWLQGLNTQRAADRFYDVMETRAQHSDYQGVSTLTLDKSVATDTSTTTVAPIAEDTPEIVPTEPNKGVIESLRDNGFINRSDNSLMIGFSKDTP